MGLFGSKKAKVQEAALVAYEPISRIKLPFKKGIYPVKAGERRYTYEISRISEGDQWVHLECREADSCYEPEPFMELVQAVAKKWNGGIWKGNILPAGEMRFQVKNDPLNLVYQWDDLFGIVLEYTQQPEEVIQFLCANYGIEEKRVP